MTRLLPHFRRGFLQHLPGVLALAGLWTAARAFAITEYDLKATFLANVLQVVKWPTTAFPDPGSSFELGILGGDPFGGAVDVAVHGLSIEGHPVVVKRARTVGALAGCQAIFICPSEAGRLGGILGTLAGSSTLTISDIPKSCPAGVMVELPMDAGRVVIEINNTEAKRALLRISSRLLHLARKLY